MGERERICGLKIAHYRKEIGYTQERFAKVMGVSVPTLRNYETGKVVPSSEFLARFSTFLDVSPELILRINIDENEENLKNLFSGGEKIDSKEKEKVLSKIKYDIQQ